MHTFANSQNFYRTISGQSAPVNPRRNLTREEWKREDREWRIAKMTEFTGMNHTYHWKTQPGITWVHPMGGRLFPSRRIFGPAGYLP